jgi:hypothetical protein
MENRVGFTKMICKSDESSKVDVRNLNHPMDTRANHGESTGDHKQHNFERAETTLHGSSHQRVIVTSSTTSHNAIISTKCAVSSAKKPKDYSTETGPTNHQHIPPLQTSSSTQEPFLPTTLPNQQDYVVVGAGLALTIGIMAIILSVCLLLQRQLKRVVQDKHSEHDDGWNNESSPVGNDAKDPFTHPKCY